MKIEQKQTRRRTWLTIHNCLFIILLLLIPVQTLLSMGNNSIYGDELYHITSGYSKLKTFDYRLFPEQGPLVPVISAFPLLFMDISFPFDDASWQIKDMGVLMPKFIFEYNTEPYKIIFSSRIPMILLSMLLAIYVYKWARQLYGRKAGILALFLYTFSPNMLAHAQISSSDFGMVFFCFIALYYFWRYLRQPNWMHLIIAGLTLGLSQLTKFSAIFLFPIYLLSIITMLFFEKPSESKNLPFKKSLARFKNPKIRQAAFLFVSFLAMLAITYLVIVVAYKGEGMFRPLSDSINEDIHLNKTLYPIQEMADSNQLMKIAMSVPSPLPYYYVRGLGFSFYYSGKPTATLVEGGHVKSAWYFFLLSFLLKTPLPEMIMLILALIFWNKLAKKPGDEAMLALPFLLFHLAFCFTQKRFGYRYLIVTIPFLLVFISKVSNLRFRSKRTTRIAKCGVILLCIWYLVSSILIYPHYLSYINELGGGPANGYKHFVDSNIDWGQDLFYLRDYVTENNITNLKLKYYGFPLTVGYPLPAYYGINYEELGCGHTEGIIAISITPLMSNQECYGWLLNETPIKRIGYSIMVYNITSSS